MTKKCIHRRQHINITTTCTSAFWLWALSTCDGATVLVSSWQPSAHYTTSNHNNNNKNSWFSSLPFGNQQRRQPGGRHHARFLLSTTAPRGGGGGGGASSSSSSSSSATIHHASTKLVNGEEQEQNLEESEQEALKDKQDNEVLQQQQPQQQLPADTSMTNNPSIPMNDDSNNNNNNNNNATDQASSYATTTSDRNSITHEYGVLVQPTIRKKTRIRAIQQWMSYYLIPSKQMIPEILAESFGTFVLLQMALGILCTSQFGNAQLDGVVPIALLTGGAITTACATVASTCAAHFNPAITLAMCVYRQFGWNRFVPYVTAQMVGATVSSVVNYLLYAAHIRNYEAAHGIVRSSAAALTTAKSFGCYFSDPVTPLAAFLSETMGTFLLTSVVFSLTAVQNKQAQGLFIPPIIGTAVALIICIIGPISCASLNPARELGPRLVLKLFGWSSHVAFAQVGLYVGAALLGAMLGGAFVDKCLYPSTSATTTAEAEGSSSSS